MSALQRVELRDQLAKSAEGVPLIGWFAYWSITNVKANVGELQKLVESLGLGADAVNPIREKSAFIRAVEDTAKAHKARHTKILDNAERTVYVTYSTHVDPSNDNAVFTVETKATLTKATSQITVVGPFEQEIKDTYADLKDNYYSEQFREMVLKLLTTHCQYITIRDRGGIYFVPATSEAALGKIKKLFSHFPESSFETVGVADMQEAKSSMWKTLVGEVNSELQAMKEDLANLPPELSDSSLDVRLERYRALREKVENYEIVLNGTANELKADLEKVTKALRERAGI